MIAACIAAGVFLALLVGAIFVFAPRPQEATVAESPTPSTTPAPSTSPTRVRRAAQATFDRRTLSIADPASLWVVVNKLDPLNPQTTRRPTWSTFPVPYVNDPTMRKEAADQIVAMFAGLQGRDRQSDAGAERVPQLRVQVNVYQGWVKQPRPGRRRPDQVRSAPA